MDDNLSLKMTDDGSHTLYSEQFEQHYHNPNGAVAESRHNFFEHNGLLDALGNHTEINILEIGFGTGLNLLLLMDYLKEIESPASICYQSIEAFPVSPKQAAALNYSEYLHHPELAESLPSIFESLEKGKNSLELMPQIDVQLFYGLFKDYQPRDISFDYIFFDAFSPRVNPELWTGEVFEKLFQWSDDEAILTTFCAASKARGAMAHANWKVARDEGALGKREMTVASPSAEPLSHLKRVNEERLARRYDEGDF